MDIEKHRDLLEKLATDDGFRSEFEADPAGTLSAHGVEFDADSLPSPATLPSKEELKRTMGDRLSAAADARSQMWPVPLWMPK